jgi:dTDP-4-amino-4,6-dideoxygalactose transaminase
VAAIFGLNISKILTSVFGGMITTDDRKLHDRLISLREKHLKKPAFNKSIHRLFYLMAVYVSFWEALYGLINKMERSGLLDRFAKYYDESVINMPSDYLEMMTGLEARVGLAQINKYVEIVKKRRQAAVYYNDNLSKNGYDLKLPPFIDGSTWSHYTMLTNNKEAILKIALKKGVQLGGLIEYNIPEMTAYGVHRCDEFPNAANYARGAINLPVWGGSKVASYVAKKV